ncbi:MAG: hypothetical protein IJL88_08580 [Clostridia bacterium]|nr:hypothetical protein [Clostridia bacterium]
MVCENDQLAAKNSHCEQKSAQAAENTSYDFHLTITTLQAAKSRSLIVLL